jgi:hypothetical protein
LIKEHPSFRGTREGDCPVSLRESSGRAPDGVSLPSTIQLRISSSGRPSGNARPTNHEVLVTSSLNSTFDGARSSGGTRSPDRVRERRGTQRSPASLSDNSLAHADSSSSIENLHWQQYENSEISVGVRRFSNNSVQDVCLLQPQRPRHIHNAKETGENPRRTTPKVSLA